MIGAEECYHEVEIQSMLPPKGNSFTVPCYKIQNPGKNEFLIIAKLICRKKSNVITPRGITR